LPVLRPYPHPVADAYGRFLFHGADLMGIERLDGVGAEGIAGICRTAPAPSAWLRQPLRSAWISDPLVVDAAFQMMILWSNAQRGAGSLPCFVGRYRQFRRSFPAGPIGVAIRINNENGSLVRADADFTDASGALIARLEDFECAVDANLERAFGKSRTVELAGADAGGNS